MKKARGDRFIWWRKPSIFDTPLRYFGAILCGYAVDFAVYAVLVAATLSIYAANTAAFCMGCCINVLLVRRFVFTDSRFALLTDVQLSLLANGLMFLLGMGLLWALTTLALINPYAAKLLGNAITFCLNYAVRALFFRKK